MNKPLRVLIIEDSEDDAVLLLRELRRGGHEPVFERVETAESMKSALQQKQWDLVISDYVLPQFSGPAALKILRESGIDLPFIIVSGNIGEEIAVEAMKAGANDYILKENLRRLIPAVERELREAEGRRERSRLMEIKKEKEFIDAVLNNIEMLVIVLDQTGKILSFNRAFEILTSYSFFEVKDRPFWDIFLTPDEVETIITLFSELRAGIAPNWHKNYWLTKSGSRRFIEWTYSVIKDVEGSVKYIIGTGIDATDRKQAEEALWQATEELQRSHDELEERVRVRTSELSGLNDDLEAEISERRQAENRLSRINSLYSILSRVNEAIVRIHNPETLFEQTCRIVVDSGLFKMAWIGLVDPQTAKVKPVASAGDSDRYLDRITIIARDVPEGRGPTGRAIVEGKVIVCPDIENDAAMLPWRESASRECFRSSAAFPLYSGPAVVGAFSIYADRAGYFTDEEIHLLSSLAEDISFAIEAISREKKRIEAENSLLASAHEIEDLYNNAPCGYHSLDKDGRIVRINNTQLAWMGHDRIKVVGRKITDFFTPESRKRFMQSYPKFLRTGEAIERELELLREDGTVLPILLNATTIRDRDNNFVMSRSTVLDITERKEREHETKAANSVLKLFSASASRSDYLNALVRLLKMWCSCSSAGIRLVGEEGEIPFAAYSGFSKKFMGQESCLTRGKDSCACIRVIDGKPLKAEMRFMSRGGSFVCNDTSHLCAESIHVLYRQACVREGFSSLAVVPIRYRNKIIGAVHLAALQKDAFTQRILVFIENITPLIGEALHRFSTEEELKISREELRALSAHLQAAREEERTKIAREIHDELGQILTAAGMELSMLQKRYKDQPALGKSVSSVIGLLNNAVGDIQRICEELRPRVLDHLGLPAAIEGYAKSFIKRTAINGSVTVRRDFPILSGEAPVALFRTVQEALTNIARHAKATKFSVRLSKKGASVVLTVKDNGRGITRKEIMLSSSLGILGIQERIRSIGGRVDIKGMPGKGTTITITISG